VSHLGPLLGRNVGFQPVAAPRQPGLDGLLDSPGIDLQPAAQSGQRAWPRAQELLDGPHGGQKAVAHLVARDRLVEEGLQHEGSGMAQGDLAVLDVDHRRTHVARDDAPGLREEVTVVGSPLGPGDHARHGPPPTTGASGALLVVGHLRRDVAQGHGAEVADVDAHLHGGRAAQHVDHGLARLQRHVLEAQFVFLHPGQFGVVLGRGQLGRVLGGEEAKGVQVAAIQGSLHLVAVEGEPGHQGGLRQVQGLQPAQAVGAQHVQVGHVQPAAAPADGEVGRLAQVQPQPLLGQVVQVVLVFQQGRSPYPLFQPGRQQGDLISPQQGLL